MPRTFQSIEPDDDEIAEAAPTAAAPPPVDLTPSELRVIGAAALGAVFEWYDFYLYGSLVGVMGVHFFGAYPEVTRNVFALLAFAAGFIVRPFGALVFGRIGDVVGRKHSFLVTVATMGLSTSLVGLLPSDSDIGILAPILLVILRMTQGLAVGGEYGGAAIYVGEHARPERRGFYTSFIQTTATFGLFLALVVTTSTQLYVNANYPDVSMPDGKSMSAFASWGWRIPFLLSFILLDISIYIRARMQESPAFLKIKAEGQISSSPLKEAFGERKNIRIALLALFGLVAGQAVVWYASQFYALLFLQNTLKVDSFTTNVLVGWSLLIGMGGILFFGALSDRFGRKPIILGGCALAALTLIPTFKLLASTAAPALYAAQSRASVQIVADPAGCTFQFNPTGVSTALTTCDRVRALFAQRSVVFASLAAAPGAPVSVKIDGQEFRADDPNFNPAVAAALLKAGYPAASDPSLVRIAIDPDRGLLNIWRVFDIFTGQKLAIIAILTYLLVLVGMVYGPIAAALVELFPTRIRYSGLSLPYHFGNGWFGGLLPALAVAMVASTGNIYSGLWYPSIVALATAAIGWHFLPETYRTDIFANTVADTNGDAPAEPKPQHATPALDEA